MYPIHVVKLPNRDLSPSTYMFCVETGQGLQEVATVTVPIHDINPTHKSTVSFNYATERMADYKEFAAPSAAKHAALDWAMKCAHDWKVAGSGLVQR